MIKDEKMRIEEIRALIFLIKSDLYCEEWDDIIDEKTDILNDIDDLLIAYQDIEM